MSAGKIAIGVGVLGVGAFAAYMLLKPATPPVQQGFNLGSLFSSLGSAIPSAITGLESLIPGLNSGGTTSPNTGS